MTRVVVLGATGTVGRPLVERLVARGDVEVVAAARNRVLLEHLEARHSVRTMRLDLTSVSASELPAADVLVDLTNSVNRHPRSVVHIAEQSIDVLGEYLQRHPGARVIHTGTFALLNVRPDLATRLCDRILWDTSYHVSKSAAERAVLRLGSPDRLQVIRLGNMAAPDMIWTRAILRAVRDGAVADPGALGRAANLTDVRALADAIFEQRPGLSYVADTAGFTWGEVINAVARATGQPELEIGSPSDGLPGSSPVGRVIRRALYLAPLSAATPPLEGLPGASVWLKPTRQVVRRQQEAPQVFPVALPLDRPIPDAGRDEQRLEPLVQDMARLFTERGWAPLAAR